jgi:hypothetical protein
MRLLILLICAVGLLVTGTAFAFNDSVPSAYARARPGARTHPQTTTQFGLRTVKILNKTVFVI